MCSAQFLLAGSHMCMNMEILHLLVHQVGFPHHLPVPNTWRLTTIRTLNSGLSRCKATILTTMPLCRPKRKSESAKNKTTF